MNIHQNEPIFYLIDEPSLDIVVNALENQLQTLIEQGKRDTDYFTKTLELMRELETIQQSLLLASYTKPSLMLSLIRKAMEQTFYQTSNHLN